MATFRWLGVFAGCLGLGLALGFGMPKECVPPVFMTSLACIVFLLVCVAPEKERLNLTLQMHLPFITGLVLPIIK